jgi:hypothetical protein
VFTNKELLLNEIKRLRSCIWKNSRKNS